MLSLCLLFLLAFAAGVLSGVVGTGSSLIMLPVLVAQYGPRVAVPVMAIASLLGNIGRVIVWWHEIRWRPVLAYSLTGVPAAVLGAHTLMTIPPAVVDVFLAAFFLAMIPLRRLIRRSHIHLRIWHMAVAGALVGFLTGFVLSTGPLSVPVFTGYLTVVVTTSVELGIATDSSQWDGRPHPKRHRCAKVDLLYTTNRGGRHHEDYDNWHRSGKKCVPNSRSRWERQAAVEKNRSNVAKWPRSFQIFHPASSAWKPVAGRITGHVSWLTRGTRSS